MSEPTISLLVAFALIPHFGIAGAAIGRLAYGPISWLIYPEALRFISHVRSTNTDRHRVGLSSFIAKSTVHVSPAQAVSFILGLFLAARICITFFAFQSEPTTGTAVSIAFSCWFVFLAWAASEMEMVGEFQSITARWLCAYLAFVVISLWWSATKSPGVGLMYWLGLAADCISVFLLARGGERAEVCRGIMKGFVIGSAVVGLTRMDASNTARSADW